MHHPPSIALTITQNICVAGGIVSGLVDLYFPQLQAEQIGEVRLKLRGKARASIQQNNSVVTDNVDLVRSDYLLWTRGAAYPPPGSHFLTLPFRFELIPNLPPSFVHLTAAVPTFIRYWVEAVGVRQGALHLNKRITSLFAVVPPDPSGTQVRLRLQKGWDGQWTTDTIQREIRRGFWGDYAHVKMEITRPLLNVLPLFVKIPFVISISTRSRPVTRDEKHVWPFPPSRPNEVRFELHSRTQVCVQGLQGDDRSGQKVASLGGMHECSGDIDIETPERGWFPSETDPAKGVWKQEIFFGSTFQLKSTPSFQFATMSMEYYLHLQVNFGGLFNTLSMDIPISVVSGIAHVFTPITSRHGTSEETEVLDLPPSYYSITDINHKD